ncbi:MAG: potassium channel family protein, partial [Acidimicrobiia bacterium]
MKVAIAGAGNVGQFIANDLADTGHNVLLIEQDPAVVARSQPALSGSRPGGGSLEWRIADACEVSSLREAEIDKVEVVVAATGDDEDNLVISLLAKQEFAVPRVIARV